MRIAKDEGRESTGKGVGKSQNLSINKNRIREENNNYNRESHRY